MYRYFTAKRTRRYVDVLLDFAHYSNTYHRPIGVAPSEVTTDNEDQARTRLYPPKPRSWTRSLKWATRCASLCSDDRSKRVRLATGRKNFCHQRTTAPLHRWLTSWRIWLVTT